MCLERLQRGHSRMSNVGSGEGSTSSLGGDGGGGAGGRAVRAGDLYCCLVEVLLICTADPHGEVKLNAWEVGV